MTEAKVSPLGGAAIILSALARLGRDRPQVVIGDISDRAIEKQRRTGPDWSVIQILDDQGLLIQEIEHDLRGLEARDGTNDAG